MFLLIYSLYPYLKEYLFGIGDGGAYVSAWVDKNADGLREENEPPLANVCVWYGYRPDSQIEDCGFEGDRVTDKNGEWGEFLAGTSCDNIYIFAAVPAGYQPTTDLAKKGCFASFGFVEEGVAVSHNVLTIDEFAQKENARIWIQNIIAGLFVLTIAFLGTKWLENS